MLFYILKLISGEYETSLQLIIEMKSVIVDRVAEQNRSSEICDI